MDDKNVQFMLDSLKILLKCGETEHAIALIDAYTEELKAENQMLWVGKMNMCKAQAEEIVKLELIYD